MLVALVALTLSSAAADAAVELRGTTVIEAERSGYLNVHAAAPLYFDPGITLPNRTVGLQGGGRLVGVFVRSAADDYASRPNALVARIDPRVFCSGACTTPQEQYTLLINGQPTEDVRYIILPEGDYRLYVLTDGPPAQVTLKLLGLDGTTTLEPDQPATVAFQTPSRRDPFPGNNLAVFGDSHTSPNPFFVFGETRGYYYDPQVAINWEVCRYKGAPAVAPLAFYPNCPGINPLDASQGDDTMSDYPLETAPYARGLSFSKFVASGTWAIGGNVQAATQPVSQGWAQTWIEMDQAHGAQAARSAAR